MSYKGLVFAAAALAVACASTAANADYYYSGYDYGSRTWNSGYGNIRPSFWGYPALLLRGDQTKVIATADEIEAAREYREYVRENTGRDTPTAPAMTGTTTGRTLQPYPAR